MLIGLPTRYAAGITLCGDQLDLRHLYETISHLAESDALPEPQQDFLLALAYDVRHAFQGDRQTKTIDEAGLDLVEYQCVNIFWPTFMVQVAMARWSAASVPTDRGHHADLFRLEAITERALHKQDPKVARRCLDILPGFLGLPGSYLVQWITECSIIYVHGSEGGKARFKRLPGIMTAMHYSSQEYQTFEAELMRLAEEQECSPHELEYERELPEFRW